MKSIIYYLLVLLFHINSHALDTVIQDHNLRLSISRSSSVKSEARWKHGPIIDVSMLNTGNGEWYFDKRYCRAGMKLIVRDSKGATIDLTGKGKALGQPLGLNRGDRQSWLVSSIKPVTLRLPLSDCAKLDVGQLYTVKIEWTLDVYRTPFVGRLKTSSSPPRRIVIVSNELNLSWQPFEPLWK